MERPVEMPQGHTMYCSRPAEAKEVRLMTGSGSIEDFSQNNQVILAQNRQIPPQVCLHKSTSDVLVS